MTLKVSALDAPADARALWASAVAGSRRSLAQALTEVERGGALAGTLVSMAGLEPHDAQIIGITGSPGVGKSTLTSALIAAVRRGGRTVAVLAIDPSSPFSGGAVLGDRIRMQDHVMDDGVFIRSAATRGHLGGLSPAAYSSVVLLEGAGFDVVLLETVGVGQSEVGLIGAADTAVVAVSPGSGDSVQTEKAGIMEIADVFVVNKADQPGAGQMVSAIKGSIDRASGRPEAIGSWLIPVIRTMAMRGEGVDELVAALDHHWAAIKASGELARRRVLRAAHLIENLALAELRARQSGGDRNDARALLLDTLAAAVVARTTDPLTAARTLLGD